MCNIQTLNAILARESVALTNKLRQIKRGRTSLQRCRERLQSKAFARAQERGVVAFDFSAHNANVLKETHLYEKMQHAYLDKRTRLQDMPDILCEWLGDRQVHVSNLEEGVAQFSEYFKEFGKPGSESSKLPLDNVTCTRMLGSSMVIISSVVELQKMLSHTFLASATLGADIPATVREILESDEGYFSAHRDHLFSEAYVGLIESLRSDHKKNELIEELLKALYPKTWEDYLAETNENLLERKKLKEEEKQWKEKFCSAKIFTKFTGSEIREFIGLSGRDLEKAIEFAKLADRGMFTKDIFMLMELGAGAEEREAHASANKFLAINCICHKDIHAAISSLGSGQLLEFPEKVNGYAKWLRRVPEKMDAVGGQEVAAVLAFTVEPPQDPKEVFQILAGNEQEILGQIQKMKPEERHLTKVFFEYRGHMKKVSEGIEKMKKKAIVRPHDELYFSTDLRWFIGERDVSAADVRRMLVYGLGLSSQKSVRAGKYVAATAFRDAWMALKDSGRDRRIRAEDAELLLRREGVLTFNKDRTLMRLNVNWRENGDEPVTEMGKEILKMTEAWIADIYPPLSEVEVEQEVGKVLSEVPLTPEEKRAEEKRIADLTRAFWNAQSKKEKIAAMDALENFGENAVPILMEGTNDMDPEVRAFSIECLRDAAGKNAAIISIIKLMHDEPVVQEAAASALGDIGGFRGIWPLTARLKNGAEGVRVECAKALGRLFAVDAVADLENASLNDESEKVRGEAMVALEMIRKKTL